jgi:hypothetical protein
MRDARVREMFNSLDSAGEGVIDGSKLGAQLSVLPEEVAAALRPMVSTFENEFFAFSDFRDLVLRALNSHAPSGPRAALHTDRGTGSVYANVQAQRMREQQTEHTFRPTLDPRSERLAAARRDTGRPIAEQLVDVQVR